MCWTILPGVAARLALPTATCRVQGGKSDLRDEGPADFRITGLVRRTPHELFANLAHSPRHYRAGSVTDGYGRRRNVSDRSRFDDYIPQSRPAAQLARRRRAGIVDTDHRSQVVLCPLHARLSWPQRNEFTVVRHAGLGHHKQHERGRRPGKRTLHRAELPAEPGPATEP